MIIQRKRDLMKRWMLVLSCLLLLVGCRSKDERLRELTANSWKVTLVSDQNNKIVSVMTEDGLTDESYARSLVFNEDHTFMMSFPQNNEECTEPKRLLAFCIIAFCIIAFCIIIFQ